MVDESAMPERRRSVNPKTKGRAEEIDLTEEDHRLLDRIHDELAADDRARRDRYAPVMGKLVAALRATDAEAVPLPNGVPVGLWWYAHHRRRDETNPKNCRNEEDWSRRLKELLVIENIPAVTEKRYPKPPVRKCDLVIQWPEIGELWLEVKGAWKHMDSMGGRKNRSFEKHLSAAGKDLKKLLTLDGSTADHIALLLIGFDTSDDPIAESDLNLVESNAGRGDWVKQYETWADPYRPQGRIHAWLWMNEALHEPDIFDRGMVT